MRLDHLPSIIDAGKEAPETTHTPTVAEVMTVAGGLGAGYGAAQVISMSGGTAGLTATTWIPTMAAGAGGVGAAGLAGYGIGQILNGMEWFKNLVNKGVDNLLINDQAMPEGELPRNFHLYTPNNDGSLPWTIKSLEAIQQELHNSNAQDVYFSSPCDSAGFADLYSNPFDTLDSIFNPVGMPTPVDVYFYLV